METIYTRSDLSDQISRAGTSGWFKCAHMYANGHIQAIASRVNSPCLDLASLGCGLLHHQLQSIASIPAVPKVCLQVHHICTCKICMWTGPRTGKNNGLQQNQVGNTHQLISVQSLRTHVHTTSLQGKPLAGLQIHVQATSLCENAIMMVAMITPHTICALFIHRHTYLSNILVLVQSWLPPSLLALPIEGQRCVNTTCAYIVAICNIDRQCCSACAQNEACMENVCCLSQLHAHKDTLHQCALHDMACT